MIGQSHKLAPAMMQATDGIDPANGEALNRSERTTRLDACWNLAAADMGSHEHAMRTRGVSKRGALRNSQSQRREQEPEEDGQLTQAGLQMT